MHSHNKLKKPKFFRLILRYHTLRLAERLLPVPALRTLCALLIVLRSKPFHSSGSGFGSISENRMDAILLGFTKRLAEGKWSRRCEFILSETALESQANKKPLILLFIHQDSFQLLPYWLRAFGIRSSIISINKSPSRLPHQLHRDRHVRFPDQKVVWHRDELRDFIDLLHQGGSLVMAVDTNLGKQTTIALNDGRSFKIANGPFRIAEKHNCEVFPCGLESLGEWKFRLRIGHKFSGDMTTLIHDLLACHKNSELSDQVLGRFTVS